jgi:hypothetical protein
VLAQLVLFRKLQRLGDCSVLAAVTDDQDLPAFLFSSFVRCAVLVLQELYSLFEHTLQPLFFIVCRDHHTHEQLGRLNWHLWRYNNLGTWLLGRFVLRGLLLGSPFIQPAR